MPLLLSTFLPFLAVAGVVAAFLTAFHVDVPGVPAGAKAAKVTAIAAFSIAVDVLSANGVSNVSDVLLFLSSLLLLASLLLLVLYCG